TQVLGYALKTSELGNSRSAFRTLVKCSEPATKRRDLFGLHLAALQSSFERRIVRQADHLDGPLDDFTFAFEVQTVCILANRHDGDVDMRREPAIEPHFLLTETLAFFER